MKTLFDPISIRFNSKIHAIAAIESLKSNHTRPLIGEIIPFERIKNRNRMRQEYKDAKFEVVYITP